jgi:hypothetical protein
VKTNRSSQDVKPRDHSFGLSSLQASPRPTSHAYEPTPSARHAHPPLHTPRPRRR